ncbi:MAG: hypothetical protein U0869_04675 [Chloroflexota bacterium]
MTGQVLMQVTDIILSMPLLVVVFILGRGARHGLVIAVIGLVFWPQTARTVGASCCPCARRSS